MTALSDALQAAQADALKGLRKMYVASSGTDKEALMGTLDAIGCGDKTDQVHLVAAWEVLRETGQAPSEPRQNGTGSTETASQRQLDYISKLADEVRKTAPTRTLTKTEASDVIEQLQAGTYDPEAWS